jgi:hypothetical protein
MSEIFMKLRIKEMLQGKMKKYLLFGFVEIFLVVAGILIALSINNWNNRRTQRNDELKIYQSISRRIQEDKLVILEDIGYNNTYLEQMRFADRIISENDRTKIDTLLHIIPNLFRYSDSDQSSNIYQNLVASGELKILENSEITTELQELEGTYIYMTRMENMHRQLILDVIGRDIIMNMDLTTVTASQPEVFYSFQFHNLIFLTIRIMEEKDDIYQYALLQINDIAALIKKDISK